MEKYRYQAFSICLESEIPLPELIPCTHQPVDVHISFCSKPVTSSIDFYIEKVGHFYVQAGQHIWVHPYEHASLDQLRLFILGSSMGAILHQRGQLVLHATAIEMGTGCCVLVGPSGNGKSTLAGAFLKRGYRVLTDDVCAVTFQNGIPHVSPGYPQIKLWRDSAEALSYNPSKLASICDREDKFAVPINELFANESRPIHQIIILKTWEEAGIELKDVTGFQKFTAIMENTYRPQFVQLSGNQRSYFDLCGQLVRQTPLLSLTRPKDVYRLNELVDALEPAIL